MEESLSLEETNKIRVSIGLKPLTEGDGGAPAADDKDAQAEDNYAKWRETEAKEKERKCVCQSTNLGFSHCWSHFAGGLSSGSQSKYIHP